MFWLRLTIAAFFLAGSPRVFAHALAECVQILASQNLKRVDEKRLRDLAQIFRDFRARHLPGPEVQRKGSRRIFGHSGSPAEVQFRVGARIADIVRELEKPAANEEGVILVFTGAGHDQILSESARRDRNFTSLSERPDYADHLNRQSIVSYVTLPFLQLRAALLSAGATYLGLDQELAVLLFLALSYVDRPYWEMNWRLMKHNFTHPAFQGLPAKTRLLPEEGGWFFRSFETIIPAATFNHLRAGRRLMLEDLEKLFMSLITPRVTLRYTGRLGSFSDGLFLSPEEIGEELRLQVHELLTLSGPKKEPQLLTVIKAAPVTEALHQRQRIGVAAPK